MNEKVEWAVVIGFERIEEVVSSTEITELATVTAEDIGDTIPAGQIEFLGGHGGSEQSHTATAIGDGELSPVGLLGSDGSAGREGRFSGAGIRQKDDAVGLESGRDPRMKPSQGLGGKIDDIHGEVNRVF